jgi:hypothetical protein
MIKSATSENLSKIFPGRTIALNTAYIDISGSITAGVLLSQMVYWATIKNFGEFYKTNEEFRAETRLGEYEFRKAKNDLINLGVIKCTRRGIPAVSYYLVDVDRLSELLSGISLPTVRVETTHHTCGNHASIYRTEITTQITTKEKEEEKETSPPARVFCSKKIDEEFEEAYQVYGVYKSKGYAEDAYKKARKAGISHYEIMKGIEAYKYDRDQQTLRNNWMPAHMNFNSWLRAKKWLDKVEFVKISNEEIERMEKIFHEDLKLQSEIHIENLPPKTWGKVSSILAEKLGVHSYKSWIAPLRPKLLTEDGCLSLEAPTRFISDWVDRNYGKDLLLAFQKISRSILDIKIIPAPSLRAA